MLEMCQLCKEDNVATRDAKTLAGPWAYVCDACFNRACHWDKGLSTRLDRPGGDEHD